MVRTPLYGLRETDGQALNKTLFEPFFSSWRWLTVFRKEKWVALKIAVASSPKHEFENLEYLRRRAQGYLWGHNIVQLLDHFTHQGPNGYHDCLVLELLGPDIRRYIGIRAGGPPKPPIDALDVNKMAGQLAAAVSFMYRAGIDHHKMEHGGKNTFTFTQAGTVYEH